MEVAAVVSVVSAVAGIAGSQIAAHKQRKFARQSQAEERKQRAIANRQAALERRRSIRQALAQARVQRAQAMQAGFQAGGGFGSSVPVGIASSLGTDVSTALGASQTQFASQVGIAESQTRQAGFMQSAQNAGTTGFAGALGGIAQIGGAFSDASALRGLSNFIGIGV